MTVGRVLRSPAWQARIMCAVVLAVVWASVFWNAWSNAQQLRSEKRVVAASNAKGFSEYVGLHLLIVDRILLTLRARDKPHASFPNHADLSADLGAMAPMLLQVAMTDAQGKVLASSLPMTGAVSIADRPHFLAFRNDPTDRAHFSPPVVGRVSGKMSLQVVRPILRDGEFQGVIVASIDPLKLQEYFQSFEAFAGGGAVMIAGRSDGIIRVRFSESEIIWGQSLLESSGWKHYSTERRGTVDVMSVVDGILRTIGFHQVGNYPLFVGASSIVRPWMLEVQDGLVITSALAAAFSLLMVLLTRARVRAASDQQRVIDQLTLSRQREIEANQIKSHFLASVSHELRTPLNAILGFSELLSNQSANPTALKFAVLIHDSGKRLHSVVNTLLDLAKIEAGRMELSVEEVDLGRLTATMVDFHQISAGKKGLTLTFSQTTPSGCTVLADTDRTKFVQVLNNVMHNAVKFTEQGTVTVSASLDGECFAVHVSDTGKGIPRDRIEHVFDRFSLAANGRSLEDGAGLGLSLTRELMTLLGGSITLTSEVGKGTQVEVRLPGVRIVNK